MFWIFFDLPQLQKLDGVLAVVENEPVLYSEFLEAVIMYGKHPDSLSKEERDSILTTLMAQKYIVALAKRDSNISVSEDEMEAFSKSYVDQIVFNLGRTAFMNFMLLDDTLKFKDTLRSLGYKDSISFNDPELSNKVIRFLGELTFRKELERYNLTERDFLEANRLLIRNQILFQKYVSMYILPKINISEDSVRRFFEVMKDSFPRQPKLYFVQQIVVPVIPSFESEEQAYWKAREIYRKLKKGANFEKLARIYSQDTLSAKKGGDLGKLPKSILKQVFPPDAYIKIVSTPEGGFTEPLRGPSGYSIIKVVSKTKDTIHLKNILIRVVPTKQDIEKARREALRIRELAKKDFEGTAKKYSILKQQIDLGYVALENVPDEEKELKAFLREAEEGDVSQPIYKEGAFIILHVKRIIPEKVVRYEDVKEQLRNMLVSKAIESLVREMFLRDKQVVVIRYFDR